MEQTMPKMTEGVFKDLLKEKLGSLYDRALAVFQNYGERLAFDVANMLMHAADKGKVIEVLGIMEEHYKNHLRYQHPDVRGVVRDRVSDNNPTEVMFLSIVKDTLKLQPTMT